MDKKKEKTMESEQELGWLAACDLSHSCFRPVWCNFLRLTKHKASRRCPSFFQRFAFETV